MAKFTTIVCFLLLSRMLLAQTIKGTHFWDCSGGACDSRTLNPWDPSKYKYAAEYAPLNPNEYGGALYGEKMWMTGAASNGLSALLNGDDGCCGSNPEGGGGCGKCVLVQNPSAVNKDWKVLVMKKNQCPPEATGCGNGNLHLDLAAPGYDNLQWSLSNTCGQPDTIITQAQSTSCGSWWNYGSNTITGCSCASFPSSTPQQQMLKKGCELFTSWGWTSGDPDLTYEIVDCPSAYTDIIQNAFGPNGPTNNGEDPGSDQDDNGDDNEDENEDEDEVPKGDFYCNWNNCNGQIQGGDWCNQYDYQCEQCGGKVCWYEQPQEEQEQEEEENPEGWYCNWSFCNGVPEGGTWCNALKAQCSACGGKICSYSDLSNDPDPETWYCNWNSCSRVTQGGDWCNQSTRQCESCGGRVCYW